MTKKMATEETTQDKSDHSELKVWMIRPTNQSSFETAWLAHFPSSHI